MTSEEKIGQLQLFEQNLHSIMNQKQQFQSQQMEIENALSELEKTQQDVYKIIGNIMVLQKCDSVKQELQSRQELVTLRLQSLTKQEDHIKEKVTLLQQEIMETMSTTNGSH